MAKLYFRFGAMNCGKTTALLQVAHNYEEKGMNILLIKPKIDKKGDNKIVSRLGIARKVDILVDTDESLKNILKLDNISCILVDEVQFMSKDQIKELWIIAKTKDIPVICYGLKTNFKGKLFEGSKAVIELADELEELIIEVNGEHPKEGTITITSGNISDVSINLNDKVIVKNDKGELVIFDSANIDVESGDGTETDSGDSLNHSGRIPEGGTYITNCSLSEESGGKLDQTNAVTLSTGDNFQSTVNDGDMYIYKNYIYVHNAYCDGENWWLTGDEGWGVKYTGSAAAPDAILESINRVAVVNLSFTFAFNDTIETAPIIPSTVKSMKVTFLGCANLKGEVVVNDDPYEYNSCFEGTSNDIVISGSCSEATKIGLSETSSGNVSY